MNSTLPLALTFLTKLPWPWRGPADETALARSMFWFPWVGALLGLIFWGAWLGLQKMPAPAAAGLLLALTVWVTGGPLAGVKLPLYRTQQAGAAATTRRTPCAS